VGPPFFSSAAPLSANTAAWVEHGPKQGLVLIPEMPLLRGEERKLEHVVK